MASRRLHIEAVVSAPFQENSYVVWREAASRCVVFDPGLEPGKIFAAVDAAELDVAAILCTHGHSDHIAGNQSLKERWPDAPLVIGAGDASKLQDPTGNLSAFFGFELRSPPADRTLSGGDRYQVAELDFRVLDVPGHSAGHVAFVLDGESPIRVFGGDVLFRQGVGRTDFPDGDSGALLRSIREQFFTLPDDSIVYPGHGPETTVGFEKQHNPFLR